jgi:hypothetical protein
MSSAVMLTAMVIQMNRVSLVMNSMTDNNTNNWMKVVMLVMMAIQQDRVSVVTNFMTKMNNNVDNCMVIMLVTMTKMNSAGSKNSILKI